jgi:hypothetical protein
MEALVESEFKVSCRRQNDDIIIDITKEQANDFMSRRIPIEIWQGFVYSKGGYLVFKEFCLEDINQILKSNPVKKPELRFSFDEFIYVIYHISVRKGLSVIIPRFLVDRDQLFIDFVGEEISICLDWCQVEANKVILPLDNIKKMYSWFKDFFPNPEPKCFEVITRLVVYFQCGSATNRCNISFLNVKCLSLEITPQNQEAIDKMIQDPIVRKYLVSKDQRYLTIKNYRQLYHELWLKANP